MTPRAEVQTGQAGQLAEPTRLHPVPIRRSYEVRESNARPLISDIRQYSGSLLLCQLTSGVELRPHSMLGRSRGQRPTKRGRCEFGARDRAIPVVRGNHDEVSPR